MKPVAHEQVPAAVHIPEPAHGGEQAEDSMLSRRREPVFADGSWETSGTESQKTKRSLELELTLDDKPNELAEREEEELENGAEGSCVNPEEPAYKDWEYIERPGCRAMLSGRECDDVEFSNPGDGERFEDGEVSA